MTEIEILKGGGSLSNETRRRSSDSGLRAAVNASDSHPRADGKTADSTLPSDGKTADGNRLKSRQEPSKNGDKIKLTLRLKPEIAMDLRLFCALKKRRLAEVVEVAVMEYCSRQQHGIDDLDDDDLSQSNHHHQIRLIYKRLTDNEWRSSDDKALKRLPMDLPIERIEMAMLMARLRAPSKIRSFGYFVPEILNPGYLGVRQSADYIRYLWKKLELQSQP